MGTPIVSQINLQASDVTATVAFCRLLGIEPTAPPDFGHVEFHFGAVSLEFDEPASVEVWNSGADASGHSAVITLAVEDRASVDTIWQRVVDAGHGSAQRPFDAFWGSRFAIVVDPDGNQFGLMSPRSDEHRSWPPTPPPTN